ncbi:MAG TPA: haloacid dehalogenase type II [Alphaproteobacteria bacterium]|nr:haloacid dehalogenase type II [Alphaproteobacteria bacterium]
MPLPPEVKACVFDAYGTLFDIAAPVRRCADALGDRAGPLAALWRAKQLEYCWLRSLMGRHADFWTLTQDALDYALEAHGLLADGALRTRLLAAYRTLDAYPEVPGLLDRLAAAGLRRAILSNGTPEMLEAAIAAAGLAGRFDAVLSVEAVGIYKPAPAVYRLACDRLGLAPAEIAFFSSNGWDAAGAAGFGFHVVWVNRAGLPAERMPDGPAAVVPNLAGVAP